MRLNWTGQIGGVAAGLGLLVVAGYFVLGPQLNSSGVSQIQEILQSPQTYDGDHIDKLVGLGSDAVPAIGEVLSSGYEFPVDLLYALREIGDPRGAESILSFISNNTPYSDSDSSHITAEAIRVLGSIPNPIVCEPLTEIFEDAASHPRLRLASAATVFRSCDSDAAAEDLLLVLWNNRRDYGRNVNTGFHQMEALTALAAATESDEIADVLIGIMNANPAHSFVPRMIEAIDGQKEGFRDALIVVLNAPPADVSFETRLMAAQRFLDLNEKPDESLRRSIEELQLEAETDGYPAELVEAARLLSRTAESRSLD